MKQWEYKVLEWTELNAMGGLDKLGEKGWELVAVCEVTLHDYSLRYYFKREKQEQ